MFGGDGADLRADLEAAGVHGFGGNTQAPAAATAMVGAGIGGMTVSLPFSGAGGAPRGGFLGNIRVSAPAPVPAPAPVIQSVPDCSICQEILVNLAPRYRDRQVRVLRCNHAFHDDCIQGWITSQQRSNRQAVCPTCRQII